MDDFSPEEMREFNENLNSMNASLGTLNSGLETLANTLNQTAQKQKDTFDDLAKTAEKVSKAEHKKGESYDTASKSIDTTAEKMAGALKIATGAVVSFSGALVSGVDGFDKYTRAVSGFGDSAKATGDALGGFGKVIGNVVNILTEFTVITMKQADAQNQFAKEMNRMGAVVDTTTQGLAESARAAGASAGDLQELAIIINQSSEALASFGAGTSEGTAKMLKVFQLGDEQEREMRRYGYTLKEAQEQQAYYIDLQRTAGINMQATEMTEKTVRLKSLQYAKTLTTLSELTGIQAGRLKEEQAAVQADLRNKIRNMRDQNDIERLKKQLDGNITAEKRASIEAEIKAREQELQVRYEAGNKFAGLLGKDMAAKVMNVIGTGAFDENTKELANLGLNAGELAKRFEGLTAGSDEYKQAIAETTGELVGGVRRNVDRFGKSMELAANASEIGAAVGINDTTTDRSMKFMSEDDAVSRVLESFNDIEDSTKRGADKQKDFASDLQVFETNFRTDVDEFINSWNPFTGAFSLATVAIAGMTTAAVVAATALYGLAGSSAAGSFMEMFGFGAGGDSGTKGPKGRGAAKKFLTRGASRFMAPLAAGMSIYSGYSDASEGREEADYNLNSTLLDENATDYEKHHARQQHEIDTKQSTNKGVGTAVGGVGGAFAGAAAGAAIGSVVPIIGTAIGGIIGGALGAWAGSSGGEMIGEFLSPEDLQMYGTKLDTNSGEYLLMTDDEKKEYHRIQELIAEQTAEQERLSNLTTKAVEENGLYDKVGWLGQSEVNFDKLVELKKDGELTSDMLEAILRDGDISDGTEKLIKEQLEILKKDEAKKEAKDKKEKDKKVAEEKVAGRTLDMSPEQLAQIFEADLKATEKREAEKQAEAEKERVAVVNAKEEAIKEQITPEVIANAINQTGSGTKPQDLIAQQAEQDKQDKRDQIIADAVALVDNNQPKIDDDGIVQVPGVEEYTSYDDAVNEASKEIAGKLAKEQEAVAAMVPELHRNVEEFIRPGLEETPYMAQRFTSTGNIKEHFATVEEANEFASTQDESFAPTQAAIDRNAADLAAEMKLADMESTRPAGVVDESSLLNTPQVDISPEPTEEDSSAGVSSKEKFAQTSPEGREMTEFEKQSIELQKQTNEKLARIDNATTETADGTQKIAINSLI